MSRRGSGDDLQNIGKKDLGVRDKIRGEDGMCMVTVLTSDTKDPDGQFTGREFDRTVVIAVDYHTVVVAVTAFDVIDVNGRDEIVIEFLEV
mgnify:FL=1